MSGARLGGPMGDGVQLTGEAVGGGPVADLRRPAHLPRVRGGRRPLAVEQVVGPVQLERVTRLEAAADPEAGGGRAVDDRGWVGLPSSFGLGSPLRAFGTGEE